MRGESSKHSSPGEGVRFSWTSIAKEKVSQHTLVFDSMWTFQPVPFRAPLSDDDPTPPPSLSLSLSLSNPMYIPIPDEAVWRNDELYLIRTHYQYTVKSLFSAVLNLAQSSI